jgi:hypothetical protein
MSLRTLMRTNLAPRRSSSTGCLRPSLTRPAEAASPARKLRRLSWAGGIQRFGAVMVGAVVGDAADGVVGESERLADEL